MLHDRKLDHNRSRQEAKIGSRMFGSWAAANGTFVPAECLITTLRFSGADRRESPKAGPLPRRHRWVNEGQVLGNRFGTSNVRIVGGFR